MERVIAAWKAQGVADSLSLALSAMAQLVLGHRLHPEVISNLTDSVRAEGYLPLFSHFTDLHI